MGITRAQESIVIKLIVVPRLVEFYYFQAVVGDIRDKVPNVHVASIFAFSTVTQPDCSIYAARKPYRIEALNDELRYMVADEALFPSPVVLKFMEADH